MIRPLHALDHLAEGEIAAWEARGSWAAEDDLLFEAALARPRQGPCLPRRVDLPVTPVASGVRAGTLLLSGWSGWRGGFTHSQLTRMFNERAHPDRRFLDQQCMVYRYRFMDRPDAYIGSATGRSTLLSRLREEIIIGPRGGVRRGSGLPRGLTRVRSLLADPGRRASFRFDIGTIVPPGVRNSTNVFILEKMLQARERPSGNPVGVRSFEDDWWM